ncbi:transcriptional regulator [Pseudonocardia nigra]|uniref:transcriptional regulator n=1 Tax=Pseudonocardia nigra TaxID=1921578 RepID=UPI001C6025A2|nr:transcriptional regulator [Pseudonocardia nigra]
MAQVTWRAPDDLVERVRAAAAEQGRSVNDYLTRLAEAATDPDLAGDDAARTRERLARAGLLVPAGPPRPRPDPDAVAAARRAAGSGTPLSDIVADSRR